MSGDSDDGRKEDFNKLIEKLSPKGLINKVQDLVAPRPRFNIDKPRYDQSTFEGRFKHFYAIVNPKNLLKSDADLDRAKEIVNKFRQGDALLDMTDDEIWAQKALVDSAFNPNTGEKLLPVGRMSAQVPSNMLITGAMMTFYKSNPAQIFLHWANQTINAIVNYSNRSGATPISATQIGTAYVLATAAGVGAALGLKHVFRNANPLFGKFVPFLAVSMSNSANIPIMRFGELSMGTSITTENGKEVGISRIAGRQGILQVILSRIVMAIPTMIFLPIVIDGLEKRGAFKKMPKVVAPLQLGLIGTILLYSTPVGCALYPQIHPISPSNLEPELQEKIKKLPGPPTTLYYNKGL
ncbi:unnamed protein product [Allacma fusca]|uniref:Sidoreflexin n=1 Tax=Allacma fusca TaxID=39272 RepID=A0A8J2KHK8_9HEXA|nr:unnamed protein product [Allacma fusca]